MAVHFVLRQHYDSPNEKYVRHFHEDTLLDWFQTRFREFAKIDVGDRDPHDVAFEHMRTLFGRNVYGFWTLVASVVQHALAPPESIGELDEQLERYLFMEGEYLLDEHVLQVSTDDDELELAYFLFDDDFLAEHGSLATFLLHEDWQLPAGDSAEPFETDLETIALLPPADGEGTLYMAFLAYYDSGNLTDIEGPKRIDGLRLPDLPRYLASTNPGGAEGGPSWRDGWPFELKLLRSQLLRIDGLDADERGFVESLRDDIDSPTWDVYSDWLHDQGRPFAPEVVLERALRRCADFPVATIENSIDTSDFGTGDLESSRAQARELLDSSGRRHDPSKSLVAVDRHAAQICLHTARWDSVDLWHQWIFFDDRWAAGQPDLANGILRFANRWDVLTVHDR